MITVEQAAMLCLNNLKLNPDYRSWSYSGAIEKAFLSGVEYAQQWISVEVEQPPQIGWYLCKVKNSEFPEVCNCFIFKENGSLQYDWSSCVTHYRPIKLM